MQRVFDHARRAYPGECCGWLSGPRHGDHVIDIRPCENAQETPGANPFVPERSRETAYVIDGADLIAFRDALATDTPPRIIYHSHPDAGAYFSAADQAVARGPWPDIGPAYPVQHLVVGVARDRVTEAALFGWYASSMTYVEIARFPGDVPFSPASGGA